MGAIRFRGLSAGLRERTIHGGIGRVLSKLFPTLLLLAAPTASAQIYADVSTSMGDFTIQLNHTAAPKTVANFIGLASGTRTWVNHENGAVEIGKPYYNGVTFHRVIKDFMSQTGSRKGDGSDGPGYTFRDTEVNNGLTHSGPHVVSMANSGPHTNGAQFFITDVATPHLNGVHIVFGSISSGQTVVDAINNVPTVDSVPTTPVVIRSISIRRVGAAALAFDEHAHGLPVVTGAKGSLRKSPDHKVMWDFSPSAGPGTVLRVFRSTSLGSGTWTESEDYRQHLGLKAVADDPLSPSVVIDQSDAPSGFYRLSVATHPEASAPSTLANRTFTMPLNGAVLTFSFDATSKAGTTTYTPASGTPLVSPFTTETFSTGAYSVQFMTDNPALNPRYIWVKAGIDSATGTTISGHHSTQSFHSWFGWQPFASGTCTITR